MQRRDFLLSDSAIALAVLSIIALGGWLATTLVRRQRYLAGLRGCGGGDATAKVSEK